MKRIVLLFVLLICLCGCTSIDEKNINNELDRVFDNLENISKYRINNNLPYFNYYLPSDMSEESYENNSVVLKYNDSKIIMNLNISNIINTRYYPNHYFEDEGFFVEDYKIYERKGEYKNVEGNKKQYVYKLFNYQNNYLIQLVTNEINYYGITYLGDIVDLSKHLLTIMKNTSVAVDKVINEFSKKDVIDYKKKQLNLFDNTLPITGELSSMLVDDAIIGNNEEIPTVIEDPTFVEEEIPNENTDEERQEEDPSNQEIPVQ